MKVQWQIVDVETGESISIGSPFEIVDCIKCCFGNVPPMAWADAIVVFGDPTARKNIGVIHATKG